MQLLPYTKQRGTIVHMTKEYSGVGNQKIMAEPSRIQICDHYIS